MRFNGKPVKLSGRETVTLLRWRVFGKVYHGYYSAYAWRARRLADARNGWRVRRGTDGIYDYTLF